MLSISIALNALSAHAICTAIYVAIAAVIGFVLSSIQTLARMSWLAWVGTICIILSGKSRVLTCSSSILTDRQCPLSPLPLGSKVILPQ